MKRIRTLVLVLLALSMAMPAAAQPFRLGDKEVKSLIEQSTRTLECFEDALDNTLKNTTSDGASSGWVVKKIGEDYRNTIEIADKRIPKHEPASDQVGRIFSDAERIDSFVAQQGAIAAGSAANARTSEVGSVSAPLAPINASFHQK